jgi:V/A-type H+-transporting ATPase subunit C
VKDWGDLVARARGLAAHLLSPAQCARLCNADGVPALAAQLANLGLVRAPSAGAPADEHALELDLRRHAAAGLHVLADWAGARRNRLAPLFDDEDRRAIRALVRGAIARIAPERRAAGLIPTPSLPLRAIDQLARAGDVATVASLLLAWGHPFGAAVEAEARRQKPDTLGFEMALVRAFATRARAAARRADAAMAHFVERTIDLENLRAMLAIAGQESDLEPAALYVAGGTIITTADLAAAGESATRSGIAVRLERRVRGTPLAAMLEPGERPPEAAALDALAGEFAQRAREAPLSLAPVIAFVLRQRAELHTLLAIVWSISLGVPRATVARAAGIAA